MPLKWRNRPKSSQTTPVGGKNADRPTGRLGIPNWRVESGHSKRRCMMCIIHTMQSRELIKLLSADGWQLQRTRGSHHQFVHPTKPGTVTVPHPKKDLGKGLVRAIRKQAGLR
jgi:predicted RNA binding protein YcfA (HicA-like mRNA interferase family)